MFRRGRIIIALTIIVGLVLLLNLIFGGNKNQSSNSSKAGKPQPTALTDYTERDSKVIFTQDGRINSEQDHRSIRITVTKNSATLEVLQGYQGKVIQANAFANNTDSYRTFLRSIERFAFNKKRTANVGDDQGVCPLSRRYISEIVESGQEKMRLWAADCQQGSSAGNTQQIAALFQQQIPNYGNLVSRVQL